MKKLLLIASFATIFSFCASTAFAELDLGLKIGYNTSKLSTNLDSIKSSMNSGFHLGAWARIGGRFHIQPEFIYTLSGATLSNVWEQKITVHSLDIPILLGFKLIDAKAIKLRINAGPKVSVPIGTTIKDVTLTGPIKDITLNSSNWSIQAGAGVDFLFMTLDVRYQAGLNDVIKEVNGSSSMQNLEGKSSMFVVSAGFKIF